MTLAPRDPPELTTGAPLRAPWAVPLGLGIGGLVAAAIVIAVGVGYDFAGRSPPPLVLLGLSLLIGPQFWLAHVLRGGRVEQLQAPPAEPRPAAISGSVDPALVATIRAIDEASQRHGSLRVAREIRRALKSLPQTDHVRQLPGGHDGE